MYEYHQNQLSIPARLLYEDWQLMSFNTYGSQCTRGKLKKTKEGRGAGNEAFVAVDYLPPHIKAICLKILGDPKQVVVRNQLEKYIVPDNQAIEFFARHRKPNGKSLSDDDQREKATNAMILNAIQMIFKDRNVSSKMFGSKKLQIWQEVSKAVNSINTDKWTYSLPGNFKRLKMKYAQYTAQGNRDYSIFIHSGEGQENALKLKGDVADFILAKYCLPNKPTAPMVLQDYNIERLHNANWPTLTEQGVNAWLNQPEQKRIWLLARDGKDAWRRNFGNSIKRDKSSWFPNVYWAIDGSKIDLIYYDPDASNKMGAKAKINIVIDVYSEKILGWSQSDTENHFDHIKAVNMALQEAQVKAYLFTYDGQSGHKMNRMQELYSNIVATNGGTHYQHKVGQKSNPMEQIFNRLQQQVINMFWNSDKQSIKAKSSRNQMNEEFIAQNKHNLPTKDQILKQWELCVKMWNNAEHPLFDKQTRNQVYAHEMPMKEEMSLLDIVSTVWVAETKKQLTYNRFGLKMRLGDQEFEFEVYDANGDIDLEFRRKNVGNKFIVRYNPDYLNDYVQLYELNENKEMVFIACAEPKRAHESVPALMKEGAKERWWKDFQTQQTELEQVKKEYEELAKRTNINRETLIQDQELAVKMGGFSTKTQRNALESVYADL